jgi:hypothetical protein
VNPYYAAFKKVHKDQVRCGARHLLEHLCKNWEGYVVTRGGHAYTKQEGVYQLTDKELFKIIGTTRRNTLYDQRQRLLDTLEGVFTIRRVKMPNMKHPANVYCCDLEAFQEWVKGPKNVAVPKTKSDTSLVGGKRYITPPSDVAESDTYTYIAPLSQCLTPAGSAGLTSLRSSGEDHQGRVVTATETETEVKERGKRPARQQAMDKQLEAFKQECEVANALSNLFPTWKVDICDIHALVDKHGPEKVYGLFNWLPLSNNPVKSKACSTDILFCFNTLLKQYNKYMDAVDHSDTWLNYESWSSLKLSVRRDAAFYEKFLDNPNDRPIDPDDAREEEESLRADDESLPEMDPIQNAFESADLEDELSPLDDFVPESIDHPYYGKWSVLGRKPFVQANAHYKKTGETTFLGAIQGKPVQIQWKPYWSPSKRRWLSHWFARSVFNEVKETVR